MSASSGSSSRSLVVIATVAGLATVYEAHWFFVPVALGFTLAAVLYPLVRLLGRFRLPPALGATLAVLLAAVLIVAIGVSLESPVRELASQVPKSVATARAKLRSMGGPFARLATFGLQDGGSASPTAAPPASGTAPSGGTGQSGGPQSMAMVQRVFGSASSFLGELVEVTLLALFLLAADGAWAVKIMRVAGDPARGRGVLDGFVEARSVVARYFLVTVAINVGQAIVIALGLMLLRYPSPALWGALTFLLEFIPYLGGMLLVLLLLIAGLASGGSLIHAIAGPALYLVVTTLQNNLVSPIAYGRGLRLNPTAILAGLILFWGMWGVAGAFLAVPILAAVEVGARRTASLAWLAALLGD